MRYSFLILAIASIGTLFGCQPQEELPPGTVVAEVAAESITLTLDQPRLWGLVQEDFASDPDIDGRGIEYQEVRIEGSGSTYHLIADGQLSDGNDRIKAYPLNLIEHEGKSLLLFPEEDV